MDMPIALRFRYLRFLLLVSTTVILFAPMVLAATRAVNTTLIDQLAIRGYDPVAYFLDSAPRKGLERYQYEWQGAKWRFVSAAHLEVFQADPEKYAPQFGGYCAWAVGHGYTADSDPEAWKIIDGKLYLNYSRKIQAKWEKDHLALILRARENWPKILAGQ